MIDPRIVILLSVSFHFFKKKFLDIFLYSLYIPISGPQILFKVSRFADEEYILY